MGEKHIYGDLFLNDKKVLTADSYLITLSASKWSNDKQTVTLDGVTPSSNIFVSPNGNPTAYAEAGIYCSKQGDYSLTFTCANTPTTNVDVDVIVMG